MADKMQSCYFFFSFMFLYMQKLPCRRAVLEKSSMHEVQKENWRSVMVTELMSSDESDGDTIMVKNLPWRSSVLQELYIKLDKQQLSKKSSHAVRLTKKRMMNGIESSRPKPSNHLPHWSYAKHQ